MAGDCLYTAFASSLDAATNSGIDAVVAAGVSLSIFLFWGWDVTLTMNEETKDPEHTPGRAARRETFSPS